MPIPSTVYRPSKLTKQQREDQMRAIYGVTMPEQLTASETALLRQLLARQQSEHKPIVTTDLNNPPKEPYRFQKFPMMVYDLNRSSPAKIVHAVVEDDDTLQDHLDAGWSVTPPNFSEQVEERLSPALQAEAERVQAVLEEKRKPGRPARAA